MPSQYQDNFSPLTTTQVQTEIATALTDYSTTAETETLITNGTADFQTAAQVTTAITAAKDKLAILSDVKSVNTAGGNAADTTSWATRTLNTEDDPDGIVTLSSNEFTLQAGTYIIEWESPAYGTNGFRSRLWNVTASTETKLGTSGFADRTVPAANEWSEGVAKITIASATTYRIEMIVGFNASGNEYGRAANSDSKDEIYTQVKITKTA